MKPIKSEVLSIGPPAWAAAGGPEGVRRGEVILCHEAVRSRMTSPTLRARMDALTGARHVRAGAIEPVKFPAYVPGEGDPSAAPPLPPPLNREGQEARTRVEFVPPRELARPGRRRRRRRGWRARGPCSSSGALPVVRPLLVLQPGRVGRGGAAGAPDSPQLILRDGLRALLPGRRWRRRRGWRA